MVRFFLFFLMLITTLSLLGQSKCDSILPFSHPEKELPIFDKSAKYDIGKLHEFIKINLNYPEKAKEDKIEGQVFVQFWIDTMGNTSEHKIHKGIRQDLDNEALRVAKLIKFDIPAKNVYDKPIGFCYMLPIRFILNEKKCKYSQKPNK